MAPDELVRLGRAALEEGRWEEAGVAFEAALAVSISPEALDGLAEVRYWQGDYDAAIRLRERAFAGFRARGEICYPARLAAYHLAFDYAAVHGNLAAAQGWLERGKRLAALSDDCPERGWVELACALGAHDLDEKDGHIAAALQIARQSKDTDLEFDALAYAGVALVERGHVVEGMRHLDEAAAAAHSGEVTSCTAAGEIYCKVLIACEMTLDVRRAEQWTEAANTLARWSNAQWASAICRTHLGGILTAAGRWEDAETELSESLRSYDVTYRALRSAAVVRLADLRVRQGQLEEAEQLLTGQEHDPYAVRPLARLHIARGDTELAAALLRRHLATNEEGVFAAPVLALLAEVEVAAGHMAEAQSLGLRLRATADAVRVPCFRALAEFVLGLGANGQNGVPHLEAALTDFRVAGLPFEEACARLELARRLQGTQPEVAIAEGKAALAIFERLGALRQVDTAAELLRRFGVKGRTGPKDVGLLTRREQEVLRLVGLGLTNPEIGARLFISRKTASHHVSNVLAKLGLRNRAEAAAFAHAVSPDFPVRGV